MKPSPHLISPDNHALTLIDHESQMAFATHSINMNDLRNNTALIAGASRIFNVPTVVTTVAEESFTGPVFPEIEKFYPKATSNYLDRTSMNAWEDEGFYYAITGLGKKRLVLAGLWTSVCIVGPALSALAEGYEVYVIADACGDVTGEAHNRAMERMALAGVRPMTALQYVLELQRDWARTDTYDAVTKLVMQYGGSYGLGIIYGKQMLSHEEAPAEVMAKA